MESLSSVDLAAALTPPNPTWSADTAWHHTPKAARLAALETPTKDGLPSGLLWWIAAFGGQRKTRDFDPAMAQRLAFGFLDEGFDPLRRWAREQGTDGKPAPAYPASAFEGPHAGAISALDVTLASGNTAALQELLERLGERAPSGVALAETAFERLDAVESNASRSSPALHSAAMRDQAEMVRWLLAQGAPVDLRDAAGQTPLHQARTRRMAKLLLDHGADATARDNAGQTPLQHWLARAFQQTAGMGLEVFRAKPNALSVSDLWQLAGVQANASSPAFESVRPVLTRLGRAAFSAGPTHELLADGVRTARVTPKSQAMAQWLLKHRPKDLSSEELTAIEAMAVHFLDQPHQGPPQAGQPGFGPGELLRLVEGLVGRPRKTHTGGVLCAHVFEHLLKSKTFEHSSAYPTGQAWDAALGGAQADLAWRADENGRSPLAQWMALLAERKVGGVRSGVVKALKDAVSRPLPFPEDTLTPAMALLQLEPAVSVRSYLERLEQGGWPTWQDLHPTDGSDLPAAVSLAWWANIVVSRHSNPLEAAEHMQQAMAQPTFPEALQPWGKRAVERLVKRGMEQTLGPGGPVSRPRM